MAPAPGFVVSLLAVLTAGSFTWMLYQRRSMPAARPLLAFAGLLLGYLLVHTALYVPGPVRTAVVATTGFDPTFGPFFRLQALLTGLGGALWFLFALQYTGRGEGLVSRTAGVLAAVWIGLGGLAAVSWIADLQLNGRPLFDAILSLGLFSMTGLLIIGTFLVAETAWERNAVGIREAGLLSGGAVTFSLTSLVASIATYPGVPPAMVLVTTLLFVVVVREYPIFDVLPVARVAGRDLLIEEMDDAVLVIDRERRVQDANAAAQATFDISGDGVRGTSLTEILPYTLAPEAVREHDTPVRIRTEKGTTLAVTADRVTDARGRWFGYVLHCTDITERQRRERRLSVLHQLLTGIVRDQLSAIADRTTVVTDMPNSDAGEDERASVGTDVQQTVSVLKSLVARTRELERDLATIEIESVHVDVLVRESVTTTEERNRIEMGNSSEHGAVTAATDPDVLRSVLTMVFEEALEHSAETVEVTLETPGHGPEIHVGFHRARGETTKHDDREQWVETTIELVRLAVESIGGTLTTVDTGAGRETVVIQLPQERAASGTDADTLVLGQSSSHSPADTQHVRGEKR
jgi:PAS domain S-box-containing protein